MTQSKMPEDNRDHTADSRNPEWDSYAPNGEGRTDEQIRADVHAAIGTEDGNQGQTLSISVQGGVVTLSGRVGSAAQQKEIVERVRAVPSVKDVKTQLSS